MTDPDIDQQEKRAINALASRLRPWATGMQDPEAFAAEFIRALREEGWKPPIGPPKVPRQHNPDTYKRGAVLAREAAAAAKAEALAKAAALAVQTSTNQNGPAQ